MLRVALVALAAIVGVQAIGDIQEYLSFIEKFSLNQSIIAQTTDFFDRREALYNAHFFPNGNDVTGVTHFQCPTMGHSSASKPSSVHSLRVNDINVVAALGDSLTAGFGAGAHTLAELTLEYRGLSFSIGGDSDLKYSVTVPNVINQFSPLVQGASRRVSPVWFKAFSKLNVAVSGARADNLTSQAHDLVDRVTGDADIDLANDWKLVTLFIGSNDLCHYCEDKTRYAPLRYKQQIKAAIDIIKAGLPRTLVQIVSPEHVNQLLEVNKISPYCAQLHTTSCPCMSDASLNGIIKQYQTHAREIQHEYAGSDDFAVVTQPFMEASKLPADASGSPDLSFFAPDCFHFSHWGHALMAKALWNNMFQPVGKKTSSWDPLNLQLMCPSSSCPLIATPANADKCKEYVAKAPALKKIHASAPAPEMVAEGEAIFIPHVIVESAGGSVLLMLLGILVGMGFGALIATLLYYTFARSQYSRAVQPSERTPLLATSNSKEGEATYVKIY